MKNFKTILFFFPSIVYSQQVELVDIKPIYKSFNLFLVVIVVALSLILVFSFLTFIYRFLKKERKITERVSLDWHLIIDNIEKDASLNEKQIESELFRLLKLYISEERGVDVTGLLDHEFLEKVKQSKVLKEMSIRSLDDFLINSGQIRFSHESLESVHQSREQNQCKVKNRIQIVKEFISEMESAKGGSE